MEIFENAEIHGVIFFQTVVNFVSVLHLHCTDEFVPFSKNQLSILAFPEINHRLY